MTYFKQSSFIKYFLFLLIIVINFNKSVAQVPYTDPTNAGDWILNTAVSDEFNSGTINEAKWLIQGKNGEYRSNFIGRAPSQFSTNNVRIENNMLKIQTKWDPTFSFTDRIKDGYAFGKLNTTDATFTCPVTTAAIIGKTAFQYGYMEISCKCADASITSAFWALGNGAEFDVFENLGKPSLPNKTQLETQIWSSIHDWTLSGGPSVWTERNQLPFRVAGGFHTWGVEWDPEFLKFYADGQLIRSITKADVVNSPSAVAAGSVGWVMDRPIYIWVDSEAFYWTGLPSQASLPVDYEIDYIRVWQKNTTGILSKKADNDVKVYCTNNTDTEFVVQKPNYDDVRVSVIDIQGKILYNEVFYNKNLIEVSSSQLKLKSGIYFVRLSDSSGVTTKKIIKG
ncbi:MAG: family 16 glycosylhydrolase [Bacteroidales bacterium]